MGDVFRSGFIGLLGRPNVGKSTLLNRLVGTKLSITSARPQTTRHRLLGIKTTADAQLIYVDTPGLHPVAGRQINRYMNRVARHSVEIADCVVMVITADGWRAGDDTVLALAKQLTQPVVLVVNKIDRCKDRRELLPLIQTASARMPFAEIVPISAKSGDNVAELESVFAMYLPERPALYPEDQLTDRSERFMAGEFVREQIFRGYGQEIPYAASVEIERFAEFNHALVIEALVWVEKEGHKAILIGKGGARLKQSGERARLAMKRFYGRKVHLKIWVKVRKGWSDDERALRRLGYVEEI